MKRNDIAKEIIIVLLIVLLAMLINGIVLYFIPVKMILPDKVEYETAQNVKDIIQTTSGVNADSVISSYTLGQDDLYTYQATNDYRPGKTNPFSSYITQTEGEGDNNSNSGSNSGSNSNSNSNSTNSSGSGKSGGNSSSGNIDKSKPIAPGEVNPGNYSNSKGLK